MGQTAEGVVAEVKSAALSKKKKKFKREVNIRVSPNSYFATFFLVSFMTGFLIYLERDTAAVALFISSWLVIPFLAWKDRIVVDGKQISRVGYFPKIWSIFRGRRHRLKISQIEQIETQALRTLRRGGSVFYFYKTTVTGKGIRFTFASGGEAYREMVGRLFSLVPNDVLDNRSMELRDFLQDPKETLMKAEFARIPSAEVLEGSLNEFQNPNRGLRNRRTEREFTESELNKADYLRQLANELRMSGYLLQALETFRRVLLIKPHDAWINFEFARCLHSYASLVKSKKLTRRAIAALRLAERKAGNDAVLLSRIGESYFQFGDWDRAQSTFYRTLGINEESFRSVRGLAEISLREGKIAHVIHHFASAAHYAASQALRIWAQGEAEYFTKLNSDEDYMEAEMTRINWLDRIETKKRLFLKFSLMSLLIVLLGVLFNGFVANVGWTASFISISIWVGIVLSQSFLSERCPIVEIDD